jgi:CRP-like cAMP-binding protein
MTEKNVALLPLEAHELVERSAAPHVATAFNQESQRQHWSAVVRLSKGAVDHLVRVDATFAKQFAMLMMRRAARLEEDLIDRAANPLRKRLARTLLILASLDVGRDANGSCRLGRLRPGACSDQPSSRWSVATTIRSKWTSSGCWSPLHRSGQHCDTG